MDVFEATVTIEKKDASEFSDEEFNDIRSLIAKKAYENSEYEYMKYIAASAKMSNKNKRINLSINLGYKIDDINAKEINEKIFQKYVDDIKQQIPSQYNVDKTIFDKQCPKILYKYCSFSATTICNLLREQIYFNSFHEFNDPFEFPDVISSKCDKIEDAGIACFTSKPDNILMWSHYADYHAGMCIGYDREKLKDIGWRDRISKEEPANGTNEDCISAELFKAIYVESYPISLGHEYKDDCITVCSKYSDWSYEDEYRLVSLRAIKRPLTHARKAVKEIYLGTRFFEKLVNSKDEENRKNRLKGLIKFLEINNEVKLMKMEPAKDKYALCSTDMNIDSLKEYLYK